ncbi:hypothetical protein [Mesobacillus harenae]|uniref:hypothetical protein n=1 Tax=Mesobacillus harenae TaxID=2213203 RepID=UPI001580D8A0|nr:hypothetical protein [Mesobacillus harenae]
MNKTDERKIYELAEEILLLLLKDQNSFNQDKMRSSIEFLARAVQDLTTERDGDRETLLKGTKTKVKIAGNCLSYKKDTKSGK